MAEGRRAGADVVGLVVGRKDHPRTVPELRVGDGHAALRRLRPAPQLIEGKYAINVLPPGQSGKGLATLALMKHLGRTGLFYIGDEETDETVFSLGKIVTMGVRVGRVDGSRAGFYLHGQAEVEGLLRLLVQWMGGPPPSEVARGPTES